VQKEIRCQSFLAHFAVYKIEILPAIDQILDFEKGFPVSREGASDYSEFGAPTKRTTLPPGWKLCFFFTSSLQSLCNKRIAGIL